MNYQKICGLLRRYTFFVAMVIPLSGCNFSLSGPKQQGEGTVNADTSEVRQVIDGFGGSNAWMSNTTDGNIKLLYDRVDGIGLSILRNRIPFREYHYDSKSENTYDDGFVVRNTDKTYKYTQTAAGVKSFSLNWGTWDLNNTKSLIAKIKALPNPPEFLTVMSTPWTPPNNSATKWKIAGEGKNAPNYTLTPDVGGVLDPNHYADYADLLADYAKNFQSNMGHPLSVLSIQNEPTWTPNYESCYWTGNNIRDFLKILGTRFSLKSVSSTIDILAAEDENFEEDSIIPTLNDSLARDVISIVGVHQYDNKNEDSLAAKKLAAVQTAGKRLWQTEVSSGDENDPSITDGIYWARMIHYDMVEAETSAFLYWWLWNTGKKSSLLDTAAVSPADQNKRLYTMGQFSKFIRPGWNRIDATAEPLSGVYSSVYTDSTSGKTAAVLINDTAADKTLTIKINGISSLVNIMMYRTSSDENTASVTSFSYDGGGSVFVTLKAQSVSTLCADIAK